MMPDMPGTNLTRDEAQTRARLLGVDSYTVELDLTTSEKTFATTTTIAFTCTETGAETFADLVGATIHEITLNGKALDPGEVYADNRITLPDLQERQRARRPRDLPLLAHGRGAAPLRRPGRRPRLHLHAVRGARRPPRLRDLRAARPQGRRSPST